MARPYREAEDNLAGADSRGAASAQRPISPHRVTRALQDILPEEAVLVCDPGTPTPFVAAEYELRRAGRWMMSPRAQGALGYAIPGVVGARMARPELPVVGLCGDGSFAISAGDLATVTRIGGPTLLILFNNGCFGWIRALQELYHGGRHFSVDFTEPLDYVRIAEGFGLRGRRASAPEEIGPALAEAVASGSPYLIEVSSAPEDEVLPPVAPWQRQTKHRMPSGG